MKNFFLNISLVLSLISLPLEAKNKQKIGGLLEFLFPLPVALYNAHSYEDWLYGQENQNKSTKNSSHNNFTLLKPHEVKTTFEDVAGLDGVKEDMKDIIAYLKSPILFKSMGARIPKGLLIHGAPGTGKTLIARALAGEVNCSFISVSGSQFVEVYVGVGSSRVRELFDLAKKHAPCIIFIDEIDALCGKRGDNREYDQTLNQLLVEMDGFSHQENPIIIVGATNRVEDLDEAILRPGRFDRILEIPKPYLQDRIYLLRKAFEKSSVQSMVDIDLIARLTQGFTGAELANLVNEALILAVREKSFVVTMKHVESAYDVITLGKENKGMVQSEQDLWETAVHESGHLVAALFLDQNKIVYKASIVPRDKTLGIAHIIPVKEVYSVTKDSMLHSIIIALAGRSAEQLFGFGLSTGASHDLEKAQKLAFDMVTKYGMSDELHNACYGRLIKDLPEDLKSKIHQEVRKIIDQCSIKAHNLVLSHKKDIEKLARLLVQKRTISGAEIYQTLYLPQPQGFSF